MIPFLYQRLPLMEEMMAAGGPIMVPLVLLSMVMWTLIIHRTLYFRRLYRKNMPRKTAAACIRENHRPDPTQYRGAVAMLVNEFMNRRSGSPDTDRQILDETVIILVSALSRHLTLIGVLARVAPLLGLLGTVFGMIATFDIISVFGTGNVRGMAGGISQALITTQTGLLVAIPGLYMHHFLTRRAENLKHRIAAVGMFLHRSI